MSKKAVPPMDVVSYSAYLKSLNYEPKEAKSRYEISDPVPVAPPLGYKESPDMVEIIRRTIRQERLRLGEAGELDESFEESEDFGDDGDLDEFETPYEDEFEPAVYVKAPTPAEEKLLETPKEPEPPAEEKPVSKKASSSAPDK